MESTSTVPDEILENWAIDRSVQYNSIIAKYEHASNSEDEHSSERTQSRVLKPTMACPVTGANHSNLLQFDVYICPRCHQHIYNDEEDAISEKDVKNKDTILTIDHSKETTKGSIKIEAEFLDQISQIRNDVGWFRREIKKRFSESDGNESDEIESDGLKESGLNVPNLREDPIGEPDRNKATGESFGARGVSTAGAYNTSGFAHKIEFQDEGENFLHRRPWEGPFDLVEARKGIEVHARKTIAGIRTILRTNLADNDNRSERERLRIIKDGLLHNPRIQFISMKQQITIRSKLIIEVLQKIVTYYPGTNVKTDMLILDSPFCILAHHLDELERFKNTFDREDSSVEINNAEATRPPTDNCTSPTFDHIEQLLHFLRNNLYSSQLDIERARHSNNPPMCTFPMMWLLYKPGTTVYFIDAEGEVSAYVVGICDVESELLETDELLQPYHLTLWNLGFDGNYVRRFKRYEVIGSFDGERPILDLQIIPAKFFDASDGGKTRQKLIERGQKWYGMLTGAQQWHYRGETRSFDKKVIDTRVVIDILAYVQQNQNLESLGSPLMDDFGAGLGVCPCERCHGGRPHPPRDFPWAEYDMINPQHGGLELQDNHPDPQHRYLLCPGILMGLALRTRTWEHLDVQLCYPSNINSKAIDTLVMPHERKRMIKAIVQKYTDPRFTPGTSAPTWGADFIEKKGEGQIFLLHGGPGVGKTYSIRAIFTKHWLECISELIGRPLLSLTCADIGTDEEVMESRLSGWFKLAERWGAVLLLDEADVWLERRMISDLKRNTLVAVFLRCLEYYRGILFLTSNRVGTFDDAFISRIHVVIKYEDLGEPERKQIWKQFFDKLERERKDTIIVESRAKHFVMNDSEMKKIPWNGREIRNAFQTAVSLAEYRYHYEGGKEESDTVVLDKVDFEQVCQMSIDFKDYLKRVHRGDDENDRAMRERARA
ncbi:P-loop containing nucleoside triphosphate hydrolase protein [Annulohypoxylon moriforme]|nr:P-loop containing nucleoside triphosphate hydrolase protein [Annulohypoxylon moriforme]